MSAPPSLGDSDRKPCSRRRAGSGDGHRLRAAALPKCAQVAGYAACPSVWKTFCQAESWWRTGPRRATHRPYHTYYFSSDGTSTHVWILCPGGGADGKDRQGALHAALPQQGGPRHRARQRRRPAVRLCFLSRCSIPVQHGAPRNSTSPGTAHILKCIHVSSHGRFLEESCSTQFYIVMPLTRRKCALGCPQTGNGLPNENLQPGLVASKSSMRGLATLFGLLVDACGVFCDSQASSGAGGQHGQGDARAAGARSGAPGGAKC